MPLPTPAAVTKLRRTVRQHYRHAGRVLPWRENLDPYAITVSEIMLQQTQVDRVIPKYENFLKRFPTVAALADSPLSQVLAAWQGLGYNRRALLLKKAADVVRSNHRGIFPPTVAVLEDLPGIGPYTARAIATFAYNQPHVLIETNIRTVYIHAFFPRHKNVHDQQLLPLIERTLDRKNPREWYWALMDYGSYLKRQVPNPNRKSAHYVRQGSFANSNRQLRGLILRTLLTTSPQTTQQLVAVAKPFAKDKVTQALTKLTNEGLITRRSSKYYIE